MSRAVLLSLTEAQVLAKCEAANVGVSAIEKLDSGGVRLVCTSAAGAEQIRRTLKAHLISGEVTRERNRPRHSTW
jgi:ABC-type transporter Mla MlaB component